jgi:uncharacterized membrane protein
MLGLFHTLCGGLALVLGPAIFLAPKGTATHVRLGRAYVLCMLSLNLSALDIYRLTGGVNVFHLLALLSLATISVGVIQIRQRRRWRKGVWRHYHYMAWSYVGLVAATSNEAFVRLAFLQHLTLRTTPWLPLLSMTAILGLSAWIIVSARKRMVARYGGNGGSAAGF